MGLGVSMSCTASTHAQNTHHAASTRAARRPMIGGTGVGGGSRPRRSACVRPLESAAAEVHRCTSSGEERRQNALACQLRLPGHGPCSAAGWRHGEASMHPAAVVSGGSHARGNLPEHQSARASPGRGWHGLWTLEASEGSGCLARSAILARTREQRHRLPGSSGMARAAPRARRSCYASLELRGGGSRTLPLRGRDQIR